jgi:hypothetical protein
MEESSAMNEQPHVRSMFSANLILLEHMQQVVFRE